MKHLRSHVDDDVLVVDVDVSFVCRSSFSFLFVVSFRLISFRCFCLLISRLGISYFIFFWTPFIFKVPSLFLGFWVSQRFSFFLVMELCYWSHRCLNDLLRVLSTNCAQRLLFLCFLLIVSPRALLGSFLFLIANRTNNGRGKRCEAGPIRSTSAISFLFVSF